MTDIKDFLKSLDEDNAGEEDELEVYADSVRQALELASKNLNLDVSMLDYDIVEKGNSGFFGFGRQPYKLLVRPAKFHDEYGDLDELDHKLSSTAPTVDFGSELAKHADGSFKVRVTKSGIWLIVSPPRGNGKPVPLNEVAAKLDSLRLTKIDVELVKKAVKDSNGEAVRLGDWVPNAEYDGSMHIEGAMMKWLRMYILSSAFFRPAYGN
jgi:predicted RNA-binding protein Jag